MNTVNVKLTQNSYKIFTGKGVLTHLSRFIERSNIGNHCYCITNATILELYKPLIKKIFPRFISVELVVVPDSERAKSQHWVFKILIQMIKKRNHLKRKFICCLGGGVVGDLGGFIAAIYKRGIPYIQIPTTLLAQIDASIGGKTAINLCNIKNIVGSFYQPKAVFIDSSFLQTLKIRQMRQGITEAIKYGVIWDAKLFEYLETNYRRILARETKSLDHIIRKAVKIKAFVVMEDEKETKGLRTILNFGHTIAHAIEATPSLSRFTHGESVGVGMIAAAYISYYLKLCSWDSLVRLKNLLLNFGLPTVISTNEDKLIESLLHDKKFVHGTIRMVLMERIGKVIVKEKIPLSIVKKALQQVNVTF